MAGLTHNLSNSVAIVGRKLLRMMDTLAESGLRQEHREISRGREIAPTPRKPGRAKSKSSGPDTAMH